MIKMCEACGGLYATQNLETFAGKPCTCVFPAPPEKGFYPASADIYAASKEFWPTPVPAEAATQDETPIDLVAWKWANTLSEGEQSVLLNSSIKRLQRMIVEHCPPSTSTTISAVDVQAMVEAIAEPWICVEDKPCGETTAVHWEELIAALTGMLFRERTTTRASAFDEAIQRTEARRVKNDTDSAYESGYNFAIGDAVEEIESLKQKES